VPPHELVGELEEDCAAGDGLADLGHEVAERMAAAGATELLDAAERDARIWIPTHFPDPFVRIVTQDGRRRSIAVRP
jgi:hypothetical protein